MDVAGSLKTLKRFGFYFFISFFFCNPLLKNHMGITLGDLNSFYE